MDEAWLYHYDPETKQQPMDLRHSGSPRSKIFRVQKICWKYSDLDFLGSRWHPPHWLSSKGPSYQRAVLLISAGIILGHFKGKTPQAVHQVCHVLARQCPLLTRYLQPRRNWPIWTSNTLITHPILRIWPLRTPTCSLNLKNNWKFAIYRPTRRSLLPRGPGWTDNLPNFSLIILQKSEQLAKKYTELRGEYVE